MQQIQNQRKPKRKTRAVHGPISARSDSQSVYLQQTEPIPIGIAVPIPFRTDKTDIPSRSVCSPTAKHIENEKEELIHNTNSRSPTRHDSHR